MQMNKIELRAAALDELRRRLRIPRAYAIDTGASDAASERCIRERSSASRSGLQGRSRQL
jgi:hypothetical protein